MSSVPFHERYPAVSADFACFFAEREVEETQILSQLINQSSPEHIRQLLEELYHMLVQDDVHVKEIQDWANIWLNDNEDQAFKWVSQLLSRICNQIRLNGDQDLIPSIPHLNSINKADPISQPRQNKTQEVAYQDISLALQCMDLTSLNDDDNCANIVDLCHKAVSKAGHVAAICVYPEFVYLAKQTLKTMGSPEVKVATVTNFPHGFGHLETALRETSLAIGAGADEVDLVFPYQSWLNGDLEIGKQMVRQCKQLCQGQAQLKVIIETGILKEPEIIKAISIACIDMGADFIKTSTGKVPVNATLEAAKVMLTAIKETGGQCGFKAAGGVKTADEAKEYLDLARGIMGVDWVQPAHFRFGASGLLSDLLKKLKIDPVNIDTDSSSSY